MFLLVVDAHSKWPEVIPMRSTTAANTIRVLRCLFSRYGLPHEVVSDNGPQFVAEDFAVFLKKNGIKHIKSAVKHPASNGEVERFVQTFKKAMKKAKPDGGDVHLKLARFLLSYRTTPHVVIQETPSKMFMGRDLRTRLSQVRPDLGLKLQQKRALKKDRVRSFEVGERVRVLDFRIHSERWSEGMVTRVLGPVTYQVVVDGIRWKRHVDQIRRMSQCVDSRAEPLRQTVPNTDIYNDRDTITRALTDEDIPNTHTHLIHLRKYLRPKTKVTQNNSNTQSKTSVVQNVTSVNQIVF
ncbi:uncharacterized protein K02A2.6-like [Strongylocentrotus purpuratus]|uniref:Integrase catalytic domain-containing protein n=1 Tax=Strongylocentrotus purpuratus TaxID=7668 RepID=A0A7M7P6P7_STRPU|nr:uncharacterized protein K02A2.6-like [Strongylocentrotus purpuratus]